MTALLSKTGRYAIQALVYLSGFPPGRLLMQRDIAAALKVPPHFLGKILQSLAAGGLISSEKGKNGGFMLGKPPGEISLLEVIRAVEGDSFLDSCLLGLPGCGFSAPCAAHEQWKKIKTSLFKMLEQDLTHFHNGFEKKIES